MTTAGGWRRKSWITRDGKQRRGSDRDKNALQVLLRNPVLAGKQRLGDQTFKGDHKAIVPKRTWEAVQRILDGNRLSGGADHRNSTGALLRGLLWCSACGRQMTHTWTKGKGGRLHRYYRCTRAVKEGAAACPTGAGCGLPALNIAARSDATSGFSSWPCAAASVSTVSVMSSTGRALLSVQADSESAASFSSARHAASGAVWAAR